MEIPLRIRILLWWKIIFRRKNNQSELVKIGEDGQGVATILFLLPAEKEYAQIAGYFVKEDFDNQLRQIHYVVHKNGLRFYPDQLKPNIITFNDKDLNFLGELVSKSILDRIRSIEYDALVDLNQSLDQTLSLLSLELDIPVKIGFQSPISDKLYTLEIQKSTKGFLEQTYETIERLLGLV